MKIRLKNLATSLSIAGILLACGCGGSGSGPNLSGLGNLPVNIPGMGSSGRSVDAGQLAQLGGKTADLMSLDSPKRQQEIGESVAIGITNKYPLSTDQALQDYVNLVGLTVASVAPNADLDYAFGVLETNEVGAYSTPGGYIFITRGALGLIEDESELAAVLAHEIAHVVKNHGIEAVKNAKLADVVSSGAQTFSAEARAYANQVEFGTDFVLVKGYSRGQESDADALAVRYVAAAGYDPAGLLRFLQRLQSRTGAGGGLGQLMSTHPGTAERVAAVQRQVAATNARGVTLRERFVANVRR
jgi:predicted Zn-dependent protease